MNRSPSTWLSSFINEVISKELSRISSKHSYGMKEALESLFEAKIDDAKKKFPAVANLLDVFKDVPQKYIFWIAKELLQGLEQKYQTSAAVEQLHKTILDFDRAVGLGKVQNKDIYFYRGADELQNLLLHIDLNTSNTKTREKAKENSKLIYKDERFTIIQPLDMSAACHYGRGTKWCISATSSKNYFDEYNSHGIQFYFVLDKTPSEPQYEKVAFAYSPKIPGKVEMYDNIDNPVSDLAITNLFPQKIFNVINSWAGTDFRSLQDLVELLRKEKFDELAPELDERSYVNNFLLTLPIEEFPIFYKFLNKKEEVKVDDFIVINVLKSKKVGIDFLLQFFASAEQPKTVAADNFYSAFLSTLILTNYTSFSKQQIERLVQLAAQNTYEKETLFNKSVRLISFYILTKNYNTSFTAENKGFVENFLTDSEYRENFRELKTNSPNLFNKLKVKNLAMDLFDRGLLPPNGIEDIQNGSWKL